jgi:hypothetical protein
MSKKKAGSGKKGAPSAPDQGRRRMLFLGLGALGSVGFGTGVAYQSGLFSSEAPAVAPPKAGIRILPPAKLTADTPTALRACEEMLAHYSHELKNASSVIHAVRGFGRDFKMGDGSRAVDFLCSRYPADKEINGKRYVYFPREAEVHDHSFLKTFLEAGVSQDQPITVGATRYTLRDLGEGAKAIFRCDPKDLYRYDKVLVHEHLPWGLIAFSILIPPSVPTWTNAYGETINLMQIVDSALSDYERTCATTQEALLSGKSEPEDFRKEIKKYSCFGMHSVYGFLTCLKHGYRENNLQKRLEQLMDLVTYRLKGDSEAIVQDYVREGQGAPPILLEALTQRALVKFYGHAFESINYAKLHRLFTFNPGQERRIEAAERGLAESIIKLRALDWGALVQTVDSMLRKGQGENFINDIIIALGHAARGMKLLTPANPDGPAQV